MNERSKMKIVVIGGTGLIGSKVVTRLGAGLPHGMCSTHKDIINADLLEFIAKEKTSSQTA